MSLCHLFQTSGTDSNKLSGIFFSNIFHQQNLLALKETHKKCINAIYDGTDKEKFFSVHAVKIHGGGGVEATYSLNLCTRWKGGVASTPPPL
jgi:hypothetical protein